MSLTKLLLLFMQFIPYCIDLYHPGNLIPDEQKGFYRIPETVLITTSL